MGVLKAIFGFLISRTFWTLVGLALLCALIWFYGPLVSVGEAEPLAGELTRVVVIGVILIAWLVSQLVRQIRAASANRMFVAELAQPAEPRPVAPGEENVAEVNEKFRNIMEQMKRSKLGGRRFLREMPWYVIIGPPGTGKTTALQQSGLHFPIDLSDDLKGVGGTRNCDWFFTEDAVLIDTAGRYVEQASDPEADAAEWRGFLDLLRKHRGRRALNGVIVALSVQELTGDEADIRAHGREIRKRLAELREKLQVHLPVYLMVTKVDLVPGFEAFFDDFSSREREQVWGATLGSDARVDGLTVTREMRTLLAALEERLVERMGGDEPLDRRAETFRFPAQMERLTAPLKVLVETVFCESRYEETPWLRGFYFTSATQEGSPIDRMVGSVAASFGLPSQAPVRRRHGEKRSFFLRDVLSALIFPEAGLGTFDPRAEERRTWIWRGTLAGSALVTALAALLFLLAYMRFSGGLDEQERQLATLSSRLANVAARQAPTDPLDLHLALEATSEVASARTDVGGGLLALVGPAAAAELERAQEIAYDRTLRNILEPRMVALLEATMWRQIRDPDYLLGALKTYQMMTGLAPYDAEFVAAWWDGALAASAPIDPFPTETDRAHQLAAIGRLAGEEEKIAPDPRLVDAALESICEIPLAVRAYQALLSDPAVARLDEWSPAEVAGPNGPQVLTRLSGESLRVGLPGAFTYAGFHETVLPLIPEIAAEAALDRAVVAGGCDESAEASPADLQGDILKLYYDDYVAKWDGLLRDVRLAPITDLTVALRNLKDLSATDSALSRLLEAVVAETHLTRTEEEDAAGGSGAGKKVFGKAASKLGTIGKLAKKGSKFVDLGGDGAAEEPPGTPVAEHFAPIRATVGEVDGQPPLLQPAVAALTTLFNTLQVVMASPNPEQALAEQGGLAQLTGAVGNEAAVLPDPIDDWIAGIARDTIDVTQEAVRDQLNARWRADVMPFCISATAGRYPFDAASAIDVNLADFDRLFNQGGLIDTFTNEHLLPYVDTTVRPWRWRADFGLPDEALEPFEKARAIRDALFPGGAGPVMNFQLVPQDLTPNASRVTLNVDGQVLAYFHSDARPTTMSWPGQDRTNMITLSFAPADGSTEVITSEVGSWAWLRLIREGRLQATELPEKFRLRLGAGGYAADFDLLAFSVDNPFDLSMFAGFSCPKSI